MGGRSYWNNKATVEGSTELCIFWLRGRGYLQGWRSGTLTWTRKLSGRTSSIGINVDVMSEEPHARLWYTATSRHDGSKHNYDYCIDLVTTPCNLGGVRYWFSCPRCGRRAGKLYLGDGGNCLCRTCSNLTYESCNDPRAGRPGGYLYVFKADRLIRELHEKMKRRTWRGRPTRKMRRIARLESKSYGCQKAIDAFLSRGPKVTWRQRG